MYATFGAGRRLRNIGCFQGQRGWCYTHRAGLVPDGKQSIHPLLNKIILTAVSSRVFSVCVLAAEGGVGMSHYDTRTVSRSTFTRKSSSFLGRVPHFCFAKRGRLVFREAIARSVVCFPSWRPFGADATRSGLSSRPSLQVGLIVITKKNGVVLLPRTFLFFHNTMSTKQRELNTITTYCSAVRLGIFLL